MTARGILAHASVLCAVSALTACSTSNISASRYPTVAPVQTAAERQPEIVPASAALNRVTAALDVNIRQIKVTGAPTSATLASADIQPRTVLISHGLQCVPFARERSGVAIRGNANTWWNQASGDFVRVKAPTVGAVMVMQTRRGHVAVVTKIIDKRQIVIDHANWLSNGQIYLDQPVLDVSANNDWSKVVVWHPNLAMYGKRALGVSGFIVDAPAHGNSTVYASLNDVPSSLTANIQYADASFATPKAAPAAVVAAPVVVAAATPAPAPVVVAAAVPAAYEAKIVPPAKPETVTLRAAATEVAEAKPVYVNTIVPGAKPAAVSAPMAVAAVEAPVTVAAATPTYVDTIVPGAKPAGVSAPMAMASAEPAAPAVVAAATYVDTIVPSAKPANLGGTAAALVAKGETTNGSTETAFVPSGKPASVATFR
ncbi:hypothetical protein sos41_09510 [Alphaproteobacteria bacterium SO-S41]|nr:hypothetical protein sos41_09510 [Alphaproteobacteria bacterium SO-S41]